MGVKQSTDGRFTSVERMYKRILYYKDRPGLDFIIREYNRTVLDDKTIMSFVSPTGVSLVRKKEDGNLYTVIITMDEAIKMLSPYLRKQKLENIMSDEKRCRTS